MVETREGGAAPTYAPAVIADCFVVRRFGSNATHLVDWPTDLMVARWIGPAVHAIPTPVAALCGAVLRDSSGAVVVMREGTKLTCVGCRRLSLRRVDPPPERSVVDLMHALEESIEAAKVARDRYGTRTTAEGLEDG